MKRKRWFLRPSGLLVMMALTLSACSSVAERTAFCDRSVRLEHEFLAVSQTLNDIANASPQQLANTFTVALSTLTTLSELGPSSLRNNFTVLLGVYESVAASLEATGWNGAIAVSDPAVIETRAQLVSNDAVQAHDAVRSYAIKNCSVEIGNTINQLPGTPTTLPNPDVANENAPEITTGFDNEDTIVSSYGYFVAEQHNLAITNEQAICIGRVLTEQALSDLKKADDAYTQLISETLTKCGVEADISGS